MSKLYKGIDISLYQKDVDFEKVKNDGIDFVIFKASQGSTPDYPNPFVDPYFERNVRRFAQTPGRIYGGSYHFLTAQTVERAKLEADFYIKTIKPYRYNLQLWAVVDVEIPTVTADRGTFSQIVKVFCDKVRDAGFRPMIYTAQWYINAYFDPPKDVPLWLVDVNTSKFPENARMWQCGYKYVDGVVGAVDYDYAYDIMGDANGDGKVNSRDVRATMQYISSKGKSGAINESQVDFDRDGKVTARDVTALMKAIM